MDIAIIIFFRPSFHFSFVEEVGKVQANPGWNEPQHETHTKVTYYYETSLDAYKKKKELRRSVWRLLSFEVDTPKTQNRKRNLLDPYELHPC